MDEIKELKNWIYSLGQSWNLFGDVDNAKYLIEKLEQRIENNKNEKVTISKDEYKKLTEIAHDGLPSSCIKNWDEVKFCPIRQGEGNACKHCSDY